MKKSFVIIVNVIIMTAILSFVVLYSGFENRDSYNRQIEHFEKTTVTMERVTENYLEGEQRVCDAWAQYINSSNMDMKEAMDYLRASYVLQNSSTHLIFSDTLTGLSNQPKQGTEDNFSVSYERIGLLDDVSWISDVGEAINITRAYTNPMNGEQSLAFCNRVRLKNQESGNSKDAVLLRVIPISELEKKWVFPQEEFSNVELSMIDSDGDYILKGYSFKNSSFFEFYKSYNSTDPVSSKELFGRITSSTGSVSMLNSHGKKCILAFTPVAATAGWTLLSFVPAEDLEADLANWMLPGVISTGLLILFLFDQFYMMQLNKRLQVAVREAESANKAKTEFLSTMSHDIRTPMNAIIGLTAIARKKLGDVKSTEENLRKISLAGNHLLTLINDILDISKVESGKLKLNPLTFSLVETVENLVNISQPMVKEKGMEFSFHIHNMDKEYLYTDQLRLNQIYINILSNAIKYTGNGGRVGVELREEESTKSGCVRLSYIVADSGMGMSPEFMKTMYQPFSRETDSRVSSIQGTGLGLAITKQMVDLMDGTIECQSELGKGTTFTVVLDIPADERQPDELRLEGIDILIADEDETFLRTVAKELEAMGAVEEKAHSGTEALEMITHRHESGNDYSIVILDRKMLDMDGVEAIRRIRSRVNADKPLLLISGYDRSDIEDEAREAGANGFISKPIFRSTLYNKINELLGTDINSSEHEDDYSDLKGMNILVAEDIEVNWEIISCMLEVMGITSERAENGRVCVEKMRSAGDGRYDLIFMDIQMPEMNGLEATREIRKLEDRRASSVPIIAMTADAFSENITECMNAGMNGHIAKPIDMKLVIREIRKIKERNEQILK